MKKYLTLFVLLIFFFTGSVTAQIAEKYTKPGRHFWNTKDPLVELHEDLRKIIADNVLLYSKSTVSIMGWNDSTLKEDMKDILDDFGFRVCIDNYDGADYKITVSKDPQAAKYQYRYGVLGYTSKEGSVTNVRLIVVNGFIEKRFNSNSDYSYRSCFRGILSIKYRRENSSRTAAFIAAIKVVAQFIDWTGMAHL